MVNFGFPINKKYAFEMTLFHKLREFKDGIDFFDFHCELNLFKDDHNPRFNLFFEIMNITIIEIDIYNMFHIDNGDKY